MSWRICDQPADGASMWHFAAWGEQRSWKWLKLGFKFDANSKSIGVHTSTCGQMQMNIVGGLCEREGWTLRGTRYTMHKDHEVALALLSAASDASL